MNGQLYNGIVLPVEWPPRDMNPQSMDPMPVPYLERPPEVVPIDVGRQLFVDDFLVSKTTLHKVYYKPERYAENPVVEAETVFETRVKPRVGLQQGGVFWNPEKDRYELFYHSGMLDPRHRHLAFSRDLVHWERPDFGAGHGNRFREPGPGGENLSPDTPGWVFVVWFDCEASGPDNRYKLLGYNRDKPWTHLLHTSPDGIRWSKPVRAGPAEDAQSLFYNPFRKVWVYSIKRNINRGGQSLRARWYAESRNFLKGGNWTNAVYWTCSDRLDKPEPPGSYPAYPFQGSACQLYALHGAAYESILLGTHEIHRGPENPVCREGRFPKLTDIELGFSRDGFHWHRPERGGFIRGVRRGGAWDRAYLHGSPSICNIHEDRLIFPYAGYSGKDPDGSNPGIYSGGAIGLASLRRDGFASFSSGQSGGELVTRPVVFAGRRLFVNADCPRGELRVEITDRDGRPAAPFTLDNCLPVSADKTRIPVKWREGSDLKSLAKQPVRFRFRMTRGDLYSFWVSRSGRGESGGYVAGGGPGFKRNMDA